MNDNMVHITIDGKVYSGAWFDDIVINENGIEHPQICYVPEVILFKHVTLVL